MGERLCLDMAKLAKRVDGLDSLLSIVQVILVDVQQFFFRQSWHLYWLLKLLLRNWWMTSPSFYSADFSETIFSFLSQEIRIKISAGKSVTCSPEVGLYKERRMKHRFREVDTQCCLLLPCGFCYGYLENF